MRKIIDRKVYDTDTAPEIMKRSWTTRHPNCPGDKLEHRRAVHRTHKGALFGYTYDVWGYGRDWNGVTGAFRRVEEDIIPFATETEAADWATVQRFDAEDVEEAFPDAVEEA